MDAARREPWSTITTPRRSTGAAVVAVVVAGAAAAAADAQSRRRCSPPRATPSGRDDDDDDDAPGTTATADAAAAADHDARARAAAQAVVAPRLLLALCPASSAAAETEAGRARVEPSRQGTITRGERVARRDAVDAPRGAGSVADGERCIVVVVCVAVWKDYVYIGARRKGRAPLSARPVGGGGGGGARVPLSRAARAVSLHLEARSPPSLTTHTISPRLSSIRKEVRPVNPAGPSPASKLNRKRARAPGLDRKGPGRNGTPSFPRPHPLLLLPAPRNP